MKYIIVGGGPTGLSLAYQLAIQGYPVELFERSYQLGGSWNAQWIDNQFFSENSPRVLSYSNYTKALLDDLGLESNDYHPIYGSITSSMSKFIRFFHSYFSFTDYIEFVLSAIKYRIVMKPHMNMHIWMEHFSNLSSQAKKALRILCITICDRPENTNINDFFSSLSANTKLMQFKDPNKWHRIIESRIHSLPHVNIHKSTEIVEILERNHSVYGVVSRNNKTKYINEHYGDRIVLCTQSDGILSIIRNSRPSIRNNWYSFSWLSRWCKETYYIGFGFQLHFREKIVFPEDWCWSCKGDWTVIILPVSDWLHKSSKHTNVQTVWSCCIVDMDTVSRRIGKTANECDVEEITSECLYQINNELPYTLPEPLKITHSEGLRRENGKWISKNTGFTRSTFGYLPVRGKMANLFAVGSFNDLGTPSISHMETAIKSSVQFMETYESSAKRFYLPSFFKDATIIFVCFLSFLFIIMCINQIKH